MPCHVIRELLDISLDDPLVSPYVSSYWRYHGEKTIVKDCKNEVFVHPSGFEVPGKNSWIQRRARVIERLSYLPVTSSLWNYEFVWEKAKELCSDLNVSPNFYVFKSVCALTYLMDHWDIHINRPRTFALIGDGYGFFGALLRKIHQNAKIYCIDLPKMLACQADIHLRSDSHIWMLIFSDDRQYLNPNIFFVLPGHMDKIQDRIDCAVNIAGMQEMNRFTVERYFKFLRKRSHGRSLFYCVNREEKKLPDGYVSKFNWYPWHKDDTIFIDDLCPYYKHFISKKTLKRGPKFLGVRIPFVNYFDGPMRHKLVNLKNMT